MYAVVKTGGKQVKLEKGMTEVVEKLDTPVGGTVTFTPLFVSDDGNALVGSDVASAVVTAEVVEHFKGEKQIVFKFKKRKGYKKLKGHRQDQTRIRVTDIALSGGEAPKKPAAKKTAPKAAAPEAAAAGEMPAVIAPQTSADMPVEEKPKRTRKPAAPKAEGEAKATKAKDEAVAEKPKRTRKPAAKKEDTPAESAE
jgi:large subunit ribosomal protein L21